MALYDRIIGESEEIGWCVIYASITGEVTPPATSLFFSVEAKSVFMRIITVMVAKNK